MIIFDMRYIFSKIPAWLYFFLMFFVNQYFLHVPLFHMHYYNLEFKELIRRCFSRKNAENRYHCCVIGSDKSYLLVHTFNLIINICRDHSHVRIFDWQHSCPVWRTGVWTDDRHSKKHYLCSAIHLLVM